MKLNQKPTRQLPQNLKALLQDIGENSVLFYLFTQIHHTTWKAFKNLEEAGCDIILLNLNSKEILKLEVKTRQSIYSSAKKKLHNSKLFQVTKLEFDSLDYLVCYWFNHHDFFIIPKADLDGEKNSIRIRIAKHKDGSYGQNEKYRNNWQTLVNKL